jgi:hypothetical protein
MAPVASFAPWPPLDATPISVRRSHTLRVRFPVVELKHTGLDPRAPIRQRQESTLGGGRSIATMDAAFRGLAANTV